MNTQDNLVNCFSKTSLDGYLPIFNNGKTFAIFQETKPPKDFKKVTDKKVINLCSVYLKDHPTLSEKERATLLKISNQIKGQRPKPIGFNERFRRLLNSLCSPFKNLFTEKSFKTDFKINCKKADALLKEVEKRKTSQQTDDQNPKFPTANTPEGKGIPENVPDLKAQETKIKPQGEDLTAQDEEPTHQNKDLTAQGEDQAPQDGELTSQEEPRPQEEVITPQQEEDTTLTVNPLLQLIQSKRNQMKLKKNQNPASTSDSEVADVGDTERTDRPPAAQIDTALEEQATNTNVLDENPIIPQQRLKLPGLPLKKVESKDIAFEKMKKNAEKAFKDQLKPMHAEEVNKEILLRVVKSLDGGAELLGPRGNYVDYDKFRARSNSEIAAKAEEMINANYRGYASYAKAMTTLDFDEARPFSLDWLEHSIFEEIGPRKTMEDRHLFLKLEGGCFHAVFDGHGGDAVADLACSMFEEKFEKTLKKFDNNIYLAFKTISYEIQMKILNQSELDSVGSTACLCYIDKKGMIYTYTIGDSKAIQFRKFSPEETYEGVLLSPEKNWTTETEAKRAAEYLDNEDLVETFTNAKNPKKLRFPNWLGLNVSRAFGDQMCNSEKEKPGISYEGKATVNQMRDGDFIVLGCDGLHDEMFPNEIAKILEKDSVNAAEPLGRYALDDAKSSDNVTIIVIGCKSK